jgi:hypothetical protein
VKAEEKIKERITEIEQDERYKSGQISPANIEINAPLALIQLALETEVGVLKWVVS